MVQVYAADAAGRGLNVGFIWSSNDFASATSSASSKLIRGLVPWTLQVSFSFRKLFHAK